MTTATAAARYKLTSSPEIEGKGAEASDERRGVGAGEKEVYSEGKSAGATSKAGESQPRDYSSKVSHAPKVTRSRKPLSDDEKLLHRAVSHIYTKLIKPSAEDGWGDWFKTHCIKFDVRKGAEHSLEYTQLHKELEAMIESELATFAEKEGLDRGFDLYSKFLSVKEDNPRMAATINLLLAAADYKKFVAMMRRHHRKLLKQGEQQAAVQRPKKISDHRGQERAGAPSQRK